MPMEISQELKELGKFKKDSYQNITSEYLLAFINALESINKLVALYRLTPSLILKKNTALGEQVINFSVL